MNKELCFCIEGIELYLEQVLVDYNNVPIFFVCKGVEMYYAVLCSDIEKLSYIVVKISPEDLYKLLHGRMPMREIFISQKKYWEINSGEDIESDEVVYKPVNEMDFSVLPEEGAYFEVLTNEVSSYVEKFDTDFLMKDGFVEVLQNPDFNEGILNEFYDDEPMKNFVELYEIQSTHKIATQYQNKDIDYAERLQSIMELNKVIFEFKGEHSEEWELLEIKTLPYTA